MRPLLLLILAIPSSAHAAKSSASKGVSADARFNECQNELAACQASADVHKNAGEYAINRAQELQNELARIANAMQAAAAKIEGSQPLKIEIEEGRMVTKLPGGVLFESGATTLRPEGKALLEALLQVLQSESARKILLAGHTDDQPISATAKGYKTNLELSVQRAISAYEFLRAAGLDPRRMGVAGYGEFDPDADNATEDGRAKNRRLEIILLPTPEELAPTTPKTTTTVTAPPTMPPPATPPR
jgi:chemotaxis protein MotB